MNSPILFLRAASPRLVHQGCTLVLVACSAALVGCSDADAPELPTADHSYKMTTSLPAGTEAEHCKFVRAPAHDIYINHDEVRYSKGSHHVLLFETPYDEIPSKNNGGKDIEYLDEAQGVFDCSEGPTQNYSVTRLVGGSQNSVGDSMVDLPPGVGVPVKANAVLLMNAHYINAGAEVLAPQVDIDLHTVPPAELVAEGGIMFWYNPFIKAPAMGSSYATTTCDIPDDVTFSNVQSHMHARGVDYQAMVIAPDKSRAEMYTNDAWEEVPVKHFGEGLTIGGGSRIEYTCFYDNPGTDDIYQGPRSTDEMCMLIGSYYPAKEHVSLCSGDASAPSATNFFGAEWKGQGTATCADSLTCMQSALGGGGGDQFATLALITDCVRAADPAVSPEFSDSVGCVLSSFLTGKDVTTTCAPAFAACSAK